MAALLWQSVFWGIRPPYRVRLWIKAMDFVGRRLDVHRGAHRALRRDGLRYPARRRLSPVRRREPGRRRRRPRARARARAGVRRAHGVEPRRERDDDRARVDARERSNRRPHDDGGQPGSVPRRAAAHRGLGDGPVAHDAVQHRRHLRRVARLRASPGLDCGVFIDKVRWYVDIAGHAARDHQGVRLRVRGLADRVPAGVLRRGGAAGVGRATNRAVVQSAVSILVLDYVVTSLVDGQGRADGFFGVRGEPKKRDARSAEEAKTDPVHIARRRVRKSYGEHEIFTGVTLRHHARQDQRHHGASGSGKTVLMRQIIRLERPGRGRHPRRRRSTSFR